MLALIMSGGLILADNINGSLLGILSVAYYALLYANPLVADDAESQQQKWDIFVKYLALIGGLLFTMTRGKMQGESTRALFGIGPYQGKYAGGPAVNTRASVSKRLKT